MRITEEDYQKVRKNIIKKLYSAKAFSKGHLLFERLQHGIPLHLAGSVKGVLRDLIKSGIVLHYGKTKYGNAFQLNIKRLKEIEEVIFGS